MCICVRISASQQTTVFKSRLFSILWLFLANPITIVISPSHALRFVKKTTKTLYCLKIYACKISLPKNYCTLLTSRHIYLIAYIYTCVSKWRIFRYSLKMNYVVVNTALLLIYLNPKLSKRVREREALSGASVHMVWLFASTQVKYKKDPWKCLLISTFDILFKIVFSILGWIRAA